MVQRIVFVLALVSVFFSFADAGCRLHRDCGTCQECDRGLCINVTPLTDPHADCPEMCGAKLVCGAEAHCVFIEQPSCDCDWTTRSCIAQEPLAVAQEEPKVQVAQEEPTNAEYEQKDFIEGDEEDIIIDLVITKDDEDSEKDTRYKSIKKQWNLHSVGVACMLGFSAMALFGALALLAKVVFSSTKPTTGNDVENGKFLLIPDLINKERKKRRSKNKKEGSIMSEYEPTSSRSSMEVIQLVSARVYDSD